MRLFTLIRRYHRGRDLVAIADQLRNERQWSRAAAAYQQAVAAQPRAAFLHVQLGHALKESGDLDAAEAAYLTALRLLPEEADISLQLGHLFNLRGDIRTAVAWYARAAELAPDNSDIAHHLGDARVRLERQASEHLVAQGLLAMQSQQFDRASALFREAVERHGRQDICALLGHALKENGDFAGAHAAYLWYRDFALERNTELLCDVEIQIGHLCKIQMSFQEGFEHYMNAKKLWFQFGVDRKILQEIEQEIGFCLNILFPVFMNI